MVAKVAIRVLSSLGFEPPGQRRTCLHRHSIGKDHDQATREPLRCHEFYSEDDHADVSKECAPLRKMFDMVDVPLRDDPARTIAIPANDQYQDIHAGDCKGRDMVRVVGASAGMSFAIIRSAIRHPLLEQEYGKAGGKGYQ